MTTSRARSFARILLSCDFLLLVGAVLTIGVMIANSLGDGPREVPLHVSRIEQVAYSPDGQRFASASFDGCVKLGRVGSWDDCRVVFQDRSAFCGVAFSPDGRRVAAANGRGLLFLADPDHPGEPEIHKLSTKELRCVAFSPDGAFVAAGGDDQILRVWDVKAARLLATLPGHSGTVSDVAFTASGRLVSVGLDGRAIVWDWRAAKPEVQVPAGCGPLKSLAVAPGGRSFAVGGREGLAIVDLSTGRPTAWEGTHGEVKAVRFSPDGRVLVAMSLWGELSFWDVRGHPRELTRRLPAERRLAQAMDLSPDGTTLLTTGGPGAESLRIWRLDPSMLDPNH